uniref:Ig-like domain-containing protein n=1 Tax=Astyanax mexicanus TaxID=7994 RepID=A0A8B9JCR7_ASTMX
MANTIHCFTCYFGKYLLNQTGNPKAGDNVTIICDSDSPLRLNISGASLNQVEKHGSSVSVNLPSIQLRDSGLYHCEARNAFGSKRSSVNVTVRAPPMNSTVLVYPSTQVMEAQNITIHCSTVSFPPARLFHLKLLNLYEYELVFFALFEV